MISSPTMHTARAGLSRDRWMMLWEDMAGPVRSAPSPTQQPQLTPSTLPPSPLIGSGPPQAAPVRLQPVPRWDRCSPWRLQRGRWGQSLQVPPTGQPGPADTRPAWGRLLSSLAFSWEQEGLWVGWANPPQRWGPTQREAEVLSSGVLDAGQGGSVVGAPDSGASALRVRLLEMDEVSPAKHWVRVSGRSGGCKNAHRGWFKSPPIRDQAGLGCGPGGHVPPWSMRGSSLFTPGHQGPAGPGKCWEDEQRSPRGTTFTSCASFR